MQTLEEDVLTLVSSPLVSQLVRCGKTAGVRRNLNFYWAFNECKKQSAFKTWRSFRCSFNIPALSCLQGKRAVVLPKRLFTCVLMARGNNSAGPKL